jgi:hypothetical protein
MKKGKGTTMKTNTDNVEVEYLTTAQDREDTLYHSLSPRPGRVILRPDPFPDTIGSLFIPDSAKTRTVKDISLPATVVSVGYGPFRQPDKKKPYPGVTPEDFGPGDRVWFRLTMEDLNKRYVVGDVRRVDAVEVRNL